MPAAVAIDPRPDREPLLGRYRPLRPLGSGGSASVWLALDEAVQREVALKVVPREGRAAERAEREAGAVERLRHPHCAKVYASARDGDHVYVVYEYVPGSTLREAMRQRSLDDRDVVLIAAQLCDALAHAHARGIVHRDVKPTNVLLEEGDGPFAKLLDFGLALVDGEDTLTAAGDVPGTLAYISPERLDGLPTTGAADIWSVGLILWEGLAGRHPFFSNASPVETARRIAGGPPAIVEERPDLPRALIRAVDAALALDPHDRPRAGQLARMLRESLAERRERRPRTRTVVVSRARLAERLMHGTAAGAFSAVMLGLFPFYPAELTIPAAATIGVVSALMPRLGLALALAPPALGLGDTSAGLAWAYAAICTTWIAIFWRRATSALLPVAGVPLGLVGALALLPLVALFARGWPARALVGGAGVAAAVAWAGLHGDPLPLTGEAPVLGIGIDATSSPSSALSALVRFPADHPTLALVAVAVTAAAALAPWVARRGIWAASLTGSLLLTGMVLAPPLMAGAAVAALPVMLACWALGAALALPGIVSLRRVTATGSEDVDDLPTQLAPLAAGRDDAPDTEGTSALDPPEIDEPDADTELWNALVGDGSAALD